MTNSQPPKDLIVMTRLNTVGLKRLAEGTLVEKKPFESRPPPPVRLSEPPRLFTPEPARLSEPPRMPLPPPPKTEPSHSDATIEVLSDDDELGADASEDRTIALGAEGSEDRTVAAPVRTPFPAPAFASRAAVALSPLSPSSSAPPPSPHSLHRNEMETPTALFVKDIQKTLQAELAKHDSSRPERSDAMSASKQPRHGLGMADTVPALTPTAAAAKVEPTFELKFEATAKTANVPAPPRSKPVSLAPPAKSSNSGLPAPLHAQASRRKDPVAVSVSTHPGRIERKGGFLPWAAALTALGVFVGIAGARIATGAPFLHAAASPAAAPAAPVAIMSEPGFAPTVAVPAVPVEKAAEPAPVAAAKPVEPVKVVEEMPAPVAAKAEEKIEKHEAKAEPFEAKSVETKAKVEAPKPQPQRPRYRPAPAPVAEKPEKSEEKVTKVEKPEPAPAPAPVAAKPKPEKTEAAPTPPKGAKPDVAAAARDYAAVQSQLGDSL